MRHLFDKPLGAVSAPFGSCFKCESQALAIGADIASTLLGGLFSSINSSASDVRQHNSARILQKWQQAYTEQNMSKAYDYAKRMYELDANYNTPRAQLQRLQEAGLNPYLVMQGATGGSPSLQNTVHPQAISAPQGASGSALPSHVAQFPQSNAASLIMQGSDIKNRQIEAFAKLADAAPGLVKAIGEEPAKRVLSSAFGQTVDTSKVNKVVDTELLIQGYEKDKVEVEATVAKLYGDKQASNIVALQEQSFNKMQAEIGKMASDAKVNDKLIDKMCSEIVRNMADAFKLTKEGNYYVASASQMNALAQLVGLNVTRLKFENKSKGFYEGSPLWNVFGQSQYVKDIGSAYELHADRAASQVEYFLNKWLGEYIKVSGSASMSGSSSTYNFNNY